MMEQDQYPLLQSHRAAHRDLYAFIDMLSRQVSAGHIGVDRALIEGLWEWESSHINTRDQEYAEFRQHMEHEGES
jgi:hemerythrin